MKTILLSIVSSLFFILPLYCQQLPLFTQYREYHGIINPAAIGNDYFSYYHGLQFGVSHRTQWVGFEGSPLTSMFKGSYILDDFGGIALLVGGHLLHDQTGPTGTTGAYGRLAGIFPFHRDPAEGGLVVGLTGGMSQFRIRTSTIELVDPNDNLTKANQKKVHPDVGAGIFFYNRVGRDDNFYAGVSVPQVFGLELTFTDETGNYSVKRVPHFYGLVGYYKYFGEASFFEPSIWARFVDGAPFQVDVNIRVEYERIVWGGVGISNNGNFHIEAGFIINEEILDGQHIKIGLGYDQSFTDFGPFAGPTYEMNVSYTLDM